MIGKRVLTAVSTLFVLAALAACDGGGSGDGGGAVPDAAAPTVVSTAPAAAATGIAVGTTVVVTFSEAMDCTSLDDASFTLNGSAPVTGSVTCSGATATFTPSAVLTANTQYTATVTTAAKDAAGNALAANRVWSFTTSNAQAWGTPVLLETAADTAYGPAVAADRLTNGSGDGSAIAVWSQYDGTQYSTYANRYSGGWSGPVLIENESTGGPADGTGSARIAMGNHGQALVVWGYNAGSNNYSIWSNRYGTGWGTAEQISGVGIGNANSPQLAYDGSSDNVFSVWSQFQSGSWNAYRITQRQFYYAPCPGFGAGCVINPEDFDWRGTSLIDPHNSGDAGDPQVAAWGVKNAVAVWVQNAAGNQIYANVASNGVWGTAVRIDTGSSSAAAPVVAVDGSGNAVAVWMDFVPGRTSLYASRYTASGATWSAPVLIDDPAGDNAGDFDPARQKVVMDANGNVVFVWQQANATRTETSIYARRCPSGALTHCGAPVKIENSTGFADFPEIALAPNGDAIAVWKQEDGAAERIYANHYSASANSWDANPRLVGGADSTWYEGPQIAIDGKGKATVVWTELEAGAHNIYANRFE